MNIKSTFANRLKELRTEKGLSQEDLGKEIGVSRGSISYYEKEERVPDIVVLAAVSKYFNVSTDYLLGISETKSLDADIHIAMETTGLSEIAVETLNWFGREEHCEAFKEELNTINFLIESEYAYVIEDFEALTTKFTDRTFFLDEKYKLDIIHKIMHYFSVDVSLNSLDVPWVDDKGKYVPFPKEKLVYDGNELDFSEILEKVFFDKIMDTLKEGKKLYNKQENKN